MRNNYVLQNQNLIYKVLLDLSIENTNPIYEDLCQEGLLALINAIDSFRDNKYKFSTYAYRCIYNHLLDILKKRQLKTISLDKEIRKEIYLMDFIANNNNKDILESICIKETYGELYNCLNNILNNEERYIICSLYGIGMIKMTQKELADDLKVTQSNIAKKHKKILDKMRENLYI